MKMTQRARANQSIDYFAFAGEHLFYEVQMFVESRAKRPVDHIEMSFKVEGFALHLKNLLEFLYPANSDANNVVAANYVADWDAKRPAITRRLDSARTRAVGELHPLTVQRIGRGAGGREWDFDGISEDLRNVVSTFIDLQPKIPELVVSELQEI
jgi:hypothetical protein